MSTAAFVEGNLEEALSERPRPGGKSKLDAKGEALLIATTCSPAPLGRRDAVAIAVLEQSAQRQHNDLQFGHRHTQAQLDARVVKQAALQREIVVLDKLLAQHQPVVDVQMRQAAGLLIEPKIILERRKLAARVRQRWLEVELVQQPLEALALGTLDQQIKIGRAAQSLREAVGAFPVAVADALRVEFIEQRGQNP
jgi:hypothetical protein